ncbi:hypothetical protein TTHERM_001326879 (macronuclear) [Tetrahymena thermophila SB210]|uniref:Uncharacterized protein n=1 Tax=Tetrahymena thermophila (strain SB210) TaxID=312017 RepID=W7X6A6_TETTS|nr:hypothetical protein TTHERM_001326879 [Tetrahymena thermophila SB210]EWS72927.1 hypothetical protein TTHERM_001326879 [Tetrahymena thermophila SB210]|eukprot:XP_012654541.1 hypothetical protein TTHERM_001326879 [Tetrahymena thermophila SB210]
MIIEELNNRDDSEISNAQSIEYTFSEKLKFTDILTRSLSLQKRLSELDQPHKFTIQPITGNEYGMILIEQPIIPTIQEQRLMVNVCMLQSLSALRGCMRIGIVSRIKTQESKFVLKKFNNHGCFMFSQDGIILHDQDQKQNLKKITDFSLIQGDILHLVYESPSKTFSIENHSANTIHTLHNVDLDNKENIDIINNMDQSSNEEIDQIKQNNYDKNYSFISSVSDQQKFQQKKNHATQKNQVIGNRYQITEEEEELDEQIETYHFAFMMGIGPSKIQIL